MLDKDAGEKRLVGFPLFTINERSLIGPHQDHDGDNDDDYPSLRLLWSIIVLHSDTCSWNETKKKDVLHGCRWG